MKPKVKTGIALLYFSPIIIFYSFIFLIPLTLVMLQSLGLYNLGEIKAVKFTTDYYATFFKAGSPYLESLWFSFWNSALAALIISVISYLLALFFHFISFKGKSFVSATYKIPLFVPYLISAFSWWSLLSPGGYIQRILVGMHVIGSGTQLINDTHGIGIIVANVWINIPYMILLLIGSLKMIDPSVIEASRTLGAGFWQTVRKVIFPLTTPGFIAGTLLVFMGMFGAFSVPFILGASWPKYMSITIYEDVVDHSKWGIGAVQAVIYMLAALAIAYAYTKIIRRIQGGRG